MAPWSTEIMDCFQSVKPDLEPDFTPAGYNKLLNSLFPINTPYTVLPRTHWLDISSAHISGTIFIIYFKNSPVFLLDLYAYRTLPRVSTRESADTQIRKQIRDMLPYCPLETLHAVCAFGTRLCFYTASAGVAISPALAPPSADVDLTHDRAPVDLWDCDLLDDDGAIRLKEVINKIRNQCENLDS